MTIIIAVTFNSRAIYRHWQPNRRRFIIIRSGIIARSLARAIYTLVRARHGAAARVSGPHIHKIEMPCRRRRLVDTPAVPATRCLRLIARARL